MKQPKPVLRVTPPVVNQAQALADLEKMDAWTEEPLQVPAQTPPKAPRKPPKAATPAEPPKEAPKPAPKPPEKPKEPWDEVSPDKLHPYQLLMTERTWLKLDRVWKRAGFASAKEFILLTLDGAIEKHLKELSK